MIDRLIIECARPAVGVGSRWALAPGSDSATRRRRLELLALAMRARPGTAIRPEQIAGVPGDLVTPARADARATMLYLHGGGYTTGSPRTHRALVAALGHELHATAFVPDYRLAPEHRFPSAHDDALACYRELADTADPDKPLLVAGDSAGGGLALVVALAARDEGWRPPTAVVLISPWLDLTTPISDSRRDPVLTPQLLRTFTDAYAPDADSRHDPRASPLLADLHGLPRLHIESGGDDPLLGQALELERAARQAGTSVTHTRHDGVWHAFHLTPLPIAARAVRGIARTLQPELTAATTPAR